MQFKVSYSLTKDIDNYLNAGWKFTYLKHGRDNIQNKLLEKFPPEFKDSLLSASDKNSAQKIVKDYLDSQPQTYHFQTPLIVNTFQYVLDQQQKNIINTLENIFQNPFPFKQIEVFITTFPINPYSFDDKWYMVNRNSSVPWLISTTLHELNHFMFLYYYQDRLLKEGMAIDKFEKLKEALAIYTNPTGNNKPDVVELESYLKTLNNLSMDEIVAKAINSPYL